MKELKQELKKSEESIGLDIFIPFSFILVLTDMAVFTYLYSLPSDHV